MLRRQWQQVLLALVLWLVSLYIVVELLASRSPSSPSTPPSYTGDMPIVMYNRVPKTGSTTIMNVLYRLCKTNGYSAIHLNVTRNRHTLALPDQMRLVRNVTEWTQRRPSVYHGHIAYIDFTLFGYAPPIYIQVVREPLDRFVTYYYFLRCGDDHRPHLTRSRAGDNTTFDECVSKGGKECDPSRMWLQIPFFCGHSAQCWQPGSRWALEQAKFNLVNRYLLVGVTEQLSEFVAVLEAVLPSMFAGASRTLEEGDGHVRRTKCKRRPTEATVEVMRRSTVWQMESAFYLFAREQFNYVKARIELAADRDGNFASELHYEKVRPNLRELGRMKERQSSSPSSQVIVY